MEQCWAVWSADYLVVKLVALVALKADWLVVWMEEKTVDLLALLMAVWWGVHWAVH